MVFQDRINEIQKKLYELSENIIYSIAEFLGYPDVPGMPIYPTDEENFRELTKNDALPRHITFIPPEQYQDPEDFTEVIIGILPYTMPVEKHFYEHKSEGFYNFYVENYSNMFFLPDWLSGYIQMQYNITVDHSNLEIGREVFLLAVLFYGAIVTFRTHLFWFISINPYTMPWVFLVDFVDWVFDSMGGLLPCYAGIDLVPSIFAMVVGKIADSANHLVFTMPFLPSEGKEVKMIIDGDVTPVVQFHYLPYLWYKYPIPMDLREFWYNDRPDILEFMETNYHQFGINFRPFLPGAEVSPTLDSTAFIDSSLTTFKHFLGLL